MKRPSIATCGLDKYSSLLSNLFENPAGLAICDPNGIPLWAHDASGGRYTTDAAASLIGRPSTASCMNAANGRPVTSIASRCMTVAPPPE